MAYGSTDEIQDLRQMVAELSANLQYERNRATAHEAAYQKQQEVIGALNAKIADLRRIIGEVELALAGLNDPAWGHLAQLVGLAVATATTGPQRVALAGRRSLLSCSCPQKPCPRHTSPVVAVTENDNGR